MIEPEPSKRPSYKVYVKLPLVPREEISDILSRPCPLGLEIMRAAPSTPAGEREQLSRIETLSLLAGLLCKDNLLTQTLAVNPASLERPCKDLVSKIFILLSKSVEWPGKVVVGVQILPAIATISTLAEELTRSSNPTLPASLLLFVQIQAFLSELKDELLTIAKSAKDCEWIPTLEVNQLDTLAPPKMSAPDDGSNFKNN